MSTDLWTEPNVEKQDPDAHKTEPSEKKSNSVRMAPTFGSLIDNITRDIRAIELTLRSSMKVTFENIEQRQSDLQSFFAARGQEMPSDNQDEQKF